MAVGKKSSHKNAARSRHLIKQAFAELLNEKDIAKITVTDIVERANISRGTFYAHYLDVYDLNMAIQSNIVEAIDETLEMIGIANIILDPSYAISLGVSYLEKNKNYFKLFLTSSHSETLLQRILSLAEEKFTHEIKELLPPEEATEYIYHIYYTFGGFRNMIIHWFMEDPVSVTSEQCSEYLTKFFTDNRPEKICEVIREKQKTENKA